MRFGRLRIPAPLLLLAPFLLLFAVFYVVPIIWAARLSLFQNRLIGGEAFVGLESYERALHDPSLSSGFEHVGILGLIQVPLAVLFALVLALTIDGRSLRGRGLYRLGIFIPFAVPTVVAGMMWGFMYDPNLGPIGQSIEAFGIEPPNLLSPDWALPSVGNILTWSGVGVGMVILYTALKAIPNDLAEAAAVDGANQRDIVRTIKVPLVRPVLGLLLLLSAIATLQLFNEPLILNQISPIAVGPDWTPNMYAYALAFEASDQNYAAAVSFLLAAIVVIVSYGGILATRLRRAG
jgi:multiple sugar transport system permease protein